MAGQEGLEPPTSGFGDRRSTIGATALKKMERETGLEPATLSLEGWRSSQLSYSRLKVVVEAGFEPAKAEPTDLQSVPFDRSGTPPIY